MTGNVFASALGPYFTLLIASLLLVMGLKLLDVLEFDTPTIIKSMPQNTTNSIFLYPILLGITLLFLFALGQGLILIIAGLFTSGLKNMRSLSSLTEWVLKLSGILLVGSAIYLYWKVFSPLF